MGDKFKYAGAMKILRKGTILFWTIEIMPESILWKIKYELCASWVLLLKTDQEKTRSRISLFVVVSKIIQTLCAVLFLWWIVSLVFHALNKTAASGGRQWFNYRGRKSYS